MNQNEFIHLVCSMSDREVDPTVKTRLAALRNKPNSEIIEEWLSILDDCCNYALTNDFIISCLSAAWTMMGGTDELKKQFRDKRVVS